MRLLDLFCGRGGWTNAFLDRGWECIGVDLFPQPEYRGTFVQADALDLSIWSHYGSGSICISGKPYEFDFICASSPCEQFSVHGMRCFHPNPKYPELGIKLFNHTRALCEASGLSYVMENVRPAEGFVGRAQNHCGSFYLWGNSVPLLLPRGIRKGMRLGTGGFDGVSPGGLPQPGRKFRDMTQEERRLQRKTDAMLSAGSKSGARAMATAAVATIPPELASCVAAYAERLLEQRATA